MAEPGPLERLRTGSAPRGLRMAIAEGMLPLDNADLIEAVSILCSDPDSGIIAALEENLPTLPRAVLVQAARDHKSSSALLEFIARLHQNDDEILTGIILNKAVSDKTLVSVAGTAPVPVLALLSENKHRMQTCPEILDTLLANPNLPRAIQYSLIEFKDTWAKFTVKPSPAEVVPPPVAESVEAPPQQQLVAEPVLDSGIADIELTKAEIELLEKEMAEEARVSAPAAPTVPRTEKAKPATQHEEKKAGLSNLAGWDIDEMTEGLAPDVEASGLEASSEDFYGVDLIDVEAEEKATKKDSHLAGWDDLEVSDEFDDVITEDLDEDDEDGRPDETQDEDKIEDTRIRLSKLSAADKLVMATMGTKQERMILVRDPNKKVAVAVVTSPKMSEFEVQLIAQNRSVCEDVLREIYNSREWGSLPTIRKDLALNPKTPLAISLRIINSLNDNDLKEVMKSKELPYGLTSSAKRLFEMREMRRQRRAK